MPKYVIEREIPKVGDLTAADMKGVAVTSCGVIRTMNRDGVDIQWVHSYVTADKIYCVYNAPDEDAVRNHATAGGFPANSIAKVERTIDPTTSE